MATSAGLSRYSEKTERWSYFTRADGLPSDQANALAFAPDGTLYVGTQCDGVAIAKPDDNYAKWQLVSAVGSDDVYRRPTGKGLPSNLINDILVASDGTVYVATSLGLAKSKNQGQAWEYIRGRDYADKVKGRAEPPPKTWSPLPKDKLAALLPEDYITCLAEDTAGRLWLGFRQQGFGVIDPKSGASFHGTKDAAKLKDSYITVLLPDVTDRALLGGYGGGAMTLKEPVPIGSSEPAVEAAPGKRDANSSPAAPHPAVAAAPTLAQLQSDLSQLRSLKEPLPAVAAVFVGDDWKTRGDWVGRLGRQYTILCAMSAPLNDALIADFRYRVRGGVGPNGGAFGPAKEKRELLRHWVHRRRWDDPRVLYNPIIGYRRQADWDDHGEAYPMSHEGPDVWASVEVPEGLHRVSLYFFNKDGHEGHNRYRSYLIEVKGNATDPARAEKLPTLARARVDQFWGGVYKQFVVSGPGKYAIKIGCNDSFNTIVQAVMLDQLTGPVGHRQDMSLPCLGGLHYDPPLEPTIGADATPVVRAATDLKVALDAARTVSGGLIRYRPQWLLAYRVALAADAPEELVGHWRWNLRIWNAADRELFSQTMSRAWKKHLEINPQLLNLNDPDQPH